MESNGNSRGGLLSAGGVLSIVLGIFQVIGGLLLGVTILVPDWFMYIQGILGPLGPGVFFMPFLRDFLWQFLVYGFFESLGLVLFATCAGILGIVAIVGGISAIRRNIFGLSLAGAICTIPSGIFGLLAVTFVALGKREFRAKVKEDGA